MNTHSNKVQPEPFQIAPDHTMQPTDHDDSRTNKQRAKRAVKTAISEVTSEASIDQNFGLFEDIACPNSCTPTRQPAGGVSPSSQRKRAKDALSASVQCLVQSLHQSSPDSSVTAALDITEIDPDHWSGPESYDSIGADTTASSSRNKRVVTLTAITPETPITLIALPVEGSETTEESKDYDELVRVALEEAKEYVEVESVLASRAFDSADCVAEFERQGVYYVIPTRKTPRVKSEIARLIKSGVTTPAVEPEVDVFVGDVRTAITNFIYIPTESDGAAVEFQPFISNLNTIIDSPDTLPELFNERFEAACHNKLLRQRMSDRLLFEDDFSASDVWIAAAEINTYQLAQIVLAGDAGELDRKRLLTFRRFLAYLQYIRHLGGTGHIE